MTEKEFILSVFEAIWPDAIDDELKERIDNFLAYHHKEYFEVEFISKTYNPDGRDWEKDHPIDFANSITKCYIENGSQYHRRNCNGTVERKCDLITF